MELHRRLCESYPSAITNACNKAGCILGVGSLSPLPIIIDADEWARITGHNGPICDYFIFPIADQLIVTVLEMKSGRLDSKTAIVQIEAGARQAERIVGQERASEFYPVVLSGRRGHSSEVKVLRGRRVRFQGTDHAIIRDRCGAQLSDIMRRYRRA